MSCEKLSEISPGGRERKGMSDAETAVELSQRPGLLIQLLTGQNL